MMLYGSISGGDDDDDDMWILKENYAIFDLLYFAR